MKVRHIFHAHGEHAQRVTSYPFDVRTAILYDARTLPGGGEHCVHDARALPGGGEHCVRDARTLPGGGEHCVRDAERSNERGVNRFRRLRRRHGQLGGEALWVRGKQRHVLVALGTA